MDVQFVDNSVHRDKKHRSIPNWNRLTPLMIASMVGSMPCVDFILRMVQQEDEKRLSEDGGAGGRLKEVMNDQSRQNEETL